MVEKYCFDIPEGGSEAIDILDYCFNDTTQSFLLNAGLKQNKKILDLGCGSGKMSCWIAKQIGKQGAVVAVDNSQNQIDAAKKYALDEKYLFSEMNEDLDKFADYVFDYHFVWPRLSQKGMIAYPMPGMGAYFNLMAEAMNIKTDANDETLAGYNQLHTQHLQDYMNTINGFERNLEKGEGTIP